LPPSGHRLCEGCTHHCAELDKAEARRRVVGMRVLHTGATTGPLDGGALTLGVDTRTGKGGGSSATVFRRMVFTLWVV
jgi:hypothetical protein